MHHRHPCFSGGNFRRKSLGTATAIMALAALAGCSTNDMVADALTGGNGGVFVTDEDPKLVREAMPFGLKVYESLLVKSPDHKGLLLATARGFTAYAYLVLTEADKLDEDSVDLARSERARAGKLFLRGKDYALRGLEAEHPGFKALLRKNVKGAIDKTDKDDIPFLYWGGMAWAGSVSADKDNLDVVADLPTAGALVARVLALDETYESGSAHEFFISYEAGRPGGSLKKARHHYRRALAISKGKRAGIYIALAEAVAIKQQNLREFRALLKKAAAVDVNIVLEFRLVNAIAHDRARWLKKRIPELFVSAGSGGNS